MIIQMMMWIPSFSLTLNTPGRVLPIDIYMAKDRNVFLATMGLTLWISAILSTSFARYD